MKIKKLIRELRGDKTQEEFAEAVGLSQVVICFAETKGRVSKETAKKLAHWSGRPIDDFIA